MDYQKTTYSGSPKIPRQTERISLLAVSVVLIVAFLILFNNRKDLFQEVEQGYKDNSVALIRKGVDKEKLATLLLVRNYISDALDAQVIAEQLELKLDQGAALPNLGALNLDRFRVEASLLDSMGGAGLKNRVWASQQALLYTPLIEQMYQQVLPPNQCRVGMGTLQITVKVVDKEQNNQEGVIVRLEKHLIEEEGYIPETEASDEEIVGSVSVEKQEKLFYATTNQYGEAVFTHLESDFYYSVLPVRKWYEYGSSKGTVRGALVKDETYRFTAVPHRMRLLDVSTYSQIKRDQAFTVRTPGEYKNSLVLYLIVFFLAWWVLHFYLVFRKKEVDELLLPLLMTLTGIGVLIIYAIHTPLTDTMQGNEMVKGVLGGILLITLLIEINLIRFFNSKYFDYFTSLSNRWKSGYIYLLLGICLAAVLAVFGSGPVGSGVKVNLHIGGLSIQPSEIIKYLLVIFFAAYFSRKTAILSQIPRIKTRIRQSLSIFVGLGLLFAIYLYTKDLGPALVLGLTFILLYSVARRDFVQMIIGVVGFVALLWMASAFFGSSKQILGIFAFAWLIIWILYGILAKKELYESAIFLVFVFSAFLFGEAIPEVGQRLKDRNEIAQNLWDNQVYGGDQVAQGIWGLATGGLTGQGLGKGNPNVIPASHTDMILTSIGEEMGWITLVLIFLCLALLLHRSLLIGRKVAHPFVFYLVAGIAIVTGVQFLVIAAGSIGLIPLTGVSVPFLSYGKISLIINLAAFGLILSASRLQGSERQQKAIRENYDDTIAFASLVYSFASIVLIGTLCWYQFIRNDHYMIKPVFAATRSGERIVEYNPRISILMKQLEAGNIYDRDGRLLATNQVELVKQQIEENIFNEAGVADSIYTQEVKQRKQRYYPFGEHLFFWTGDYNTRLLWQDGENGAGFIAERRHLSELRGFDTHPQAVSLPSRRYKPNRFMPAHEQVFDRFIYDYSALKPLLKAGADSRKVRKFNNEKRHIWLTVDARLQTQLQNGLNRAFTTGSFRGQAYANSRASVVVLNAGNGELLASANYPLPDQSLLKSLYDQSGADITENILLTERDLGVTYATAPGSTAKVLSALAGLRKQDVTEAAQKRFRVYPEERIRVSSRESEPAGWVNLRDAIVRSSNIYFIKLINEESLDDQLSDLYLATGVKINREGAYTFYYNKEDKKGETLLREHWQEVYNDRRDTYTNEKLAPKNRLRSEFSSLAWGQGKMDATPLTMARAAAIVANKGQMMETKYILKSSKTLDIPEQNALQLVSTSSADTLKLYMQAQAETFSRQNRVSVYGKTGTPNRIVNGKKVNDAWYLFFVYSPQNEPLAIAIRIEQGVASSNAQKLAAEVVVPTLKSLGYIGNN